VWLRCSRDDGVRVGEPSQLLAEPGRFRVADADRNSKSILVSAVVQHLQALERYYREFEESASARVDGLKV
jgi:hypothetical protein